VLLLEAAKSYEHMT